jgi:AcrR family transcriptional regulator
VPSKKPAEKAAAPKRRSPISRAEGERRLIAAATQLIREKPFSEVGVREIGQLADVNHGFVHTWFGGKNELLRAVAMQQVLEIAANVPEVQAGTPALVLTPEITAVIRLIMWLDLEGFDVGLKSIVTPIIEVMTARFIEIEKLQPSVAREMAVQAVYLGAGAATIGQMAGIADEQAGRDMYLFMRHIYGLLATYPPT